MPSSVAKIALFLSSYFPLAVIFAVQLLVRGEIGWGVFSLALGGAGLVVTGLYMRFLLRFNPHTIRITSVSRQDSQVPSYLVSYLLPFIELPSGDPGTAIGLALFLIVLCVLYVNSSLILINPMLKIVGWQIYEVVRDDGEICTLLTRRRVRKNTVIEVVDMAVNIYIGV